MRVKPSTKAFASSMTSAIVPIIQKANAAERSDVGARVMASLHGREIPPLEAPLPRFSRDEQFATKMFRSFNEVQTCIERLKDCETYISRFPFGGTRVSRAAYLQCMVEVHLHELYVLHERLQAWLKQIERAYKSDSRGKAVGKVTEILSSRTSKSLQPLLSIRGRHVHEWRYDNPDISRLQLIDLLAKAPENDFAKAIRILRRSATTDTHSRLKQQAKLWNALATEVIDLILSHLAKVFFTADGKSFLYPSPIRSKSET